MFSLIETIDKQYPLSEYQASLKKTIRDVLNVQYANNNLTERPKSMKIFQELPLDQRLHLLDSEAGLDVAEEVSARLLRIKSREEQMTTGTTTRFWAQGRLSLRDTEARSVASLVEWAYDESMLNFEDAEHLYDIWALATRLEFDVLARECMDRLFKTASASIRDAFSNNIGLGHLIGLTRAQDAPGLADDVVTTVFHHVLKDDNPPAKLSDLVIRALARGLDSELWAQLKSMVSHDTACKLIDALVALKVLKVEQGGVDGSLVKYEGQQDAHMT